MFLGRETQAARGGKIESARIARNLANDEGDVAASQPFLDRKQRILAAAGFDMDQTAAHSFWKSVEERPPASPDRLAILHPQHHSPVITAGECRRAILAHPVTSQRQGQTGPARLP